jgi:general secretion pathway protein H
MREPIGTRTRGGPHTGVAGFTLIEVLVVLTIVGLVLSGVSWSVEALRHRDGDLAATAERAQIRGQPIAIELLPDGYRFSVLDPDGRWIAWEAPPVFAERRLPESFRWGTLSGGSGVERRIIFGIRAPRFELTVHTPKGTLRYTGRSTGAVLLEAHNAVPS